MREIKFRAWHFGFVMRGVPPQMLYDEKPGECLMWKNQGQNIGEIMQYTGLKDKNEKEIYESDILLIGGFNYEVRYYNYTGGYALYRIGQDFWTYVFNETLTEISEVIGNIYMNPELLTKE